MSRPDWWRRAGGLGFIPIAFFISRISTTSENSTLAPANYFGAGSECHSNSHPIFRNFKLRPLPSGQYGRRIPER